LNAEQEVQEDEGERVPVTHEADDVEREPQEHSTRLDDEKRPRTDSGSDLVGEHLAEGGFVVVQNIDGMLMIVGVELAVVERLLERGLSGIAGSN
jgi:hypothetical protein